MWWWVTTTREVKAGEKRIKNTFILCATFFLLRFLLCHSFVFTKSWKPTPSWNKMPKIYVKKYMTSCSSTPKSVLSTTIYGNACCWCEWNSTQLLYKNPKPLTLFIEGTQKKWLDTSIHFQANQVPLLTPSRPCHVNKTTLTIYRQIINI